MKIKVMKILGAVVTSLVAAVVIACLLSKPPPLPENDKAAIAQLEKWVPVGTPLADAEHIMEQHGFHGTMNKTGYWCSISQVIRGVPYYDCSLSFSSFRVPSNINYRVALFIENDKVKSVDVITVQDGI
ncbi:MAG TPA: hypothetical protein VK737_00145 [Opitutales bacterium]|nr:hypothetical protein [Opitutales bacterium]